MQRTFGFIQKSKFNEGNTGMGKIREMEKLAKRPGVKMAVVQVKYGESLKKVWNRHLYCLPKVLSFIFPSPLEGRGSG
jgi:hypothetical protein